MAADISTYPIIKLAHSICWLQAGMAVDARSVTRNFDRFSDSDTFISWMIALRANVIFFDFFAGTLIEKVFKIICF